MKQTISSREARISPTAPRPLPKGRVYSFDVFDTLLTRAVGPPRKVFLLLGKRLRRSGNLDLEVHEFARIRGEAERRAHRNSGRTDSDADIHQIYEEMAQVLGLAREDIPSLIELELGLERELLRPVPSVIDRARAHHRQGDRIVFISDTYHPENVLRGWLEEHLDFEVGDRLYVSNRFGSAKRSGRLFEIVAERENVRPQDILHVGNDERADVRSARRYGVRTDRFVAANLNRYEEILGSSSNASGVDSALAGASRLTRLHRPSEEESVLWNVAASVAAPFLVAYVLHLLRWTRRKGIERVYFLSRDGQILHQIAEVLAHRLRIDVELEYLHVSRAVLNPPVLAAMPERFHPLLWSHMNQPSIRRILDRVGLQPEEVEEELEELGVGSDFDSPVGEEAFRRIRLSLRTGALSRAQENVRQRIAPLLYDYLEDAGFFEDVEIGVVDLSGIGSQFVALNHLREERKLPPVHALLAFRNPFPADLDGKDLNEIVPSVDVWFFDAERNLGVRPFPGFTALLETIGAADHGSVVGYERAADGGVRPVLAEGHSDRMRAWGLPTVHASIRTFTEKLLLDPVALEEAFDVREAVLKVLRLFWRQPSRPEALAWGSFPLETGSGAGANWEAIAQPLTPADFLRIGTRKQKRRGWNHWLRGSVQLTGWYLRLAVRLFDEYRRFRSPSRGA